MITASPALRPLARPIRSDAPGAAVRALLVAACLAALGGCETLQTELARITDRGDAAAEPTPAETVPAATQPEPAQPAAVDEPSAPPAEQTSADQKTSPVRRIRVTVLDPADFEQAREKHLQALILGASAPLAADEVGFYMDIQNAQLVQVLRPTSIAIAREGDLITLTLHGGETFETNSARLQPGAAQSLAIAAQVLAEYAKTRVMVHGHTDDSGEAAYNQQLSVRRALSVADHLLDAGIAPARVAVAGFGESRPLVANTTPEARAHNRRVELFLEPIVR